MIHKKSNLSTLILITTLLIIGFSGCARYSANPLKRHTKDSLTIAKNQSVSLSYRLFTKADCKRYLDRNVLAKGYQPILITLSNGSNQSFYMSYDSMSLPCISPEEVARSVHTSTTGRAVGYGLAGLIIWPLLIPAVIDGIGSSEANALLDADFSDKSFDKKQVIFPHSTVTGLVFVETELFDENFTIKLTNATSLQDVTLSPSNPCVTIEL